MMGRSGQNDGAWFAHKTHGYGAGLPVAWQGWVVLVVYMVVAGFSSWLAYAMERTGVFLAVAVMIIATIILFIISARTTRGGWRWRWGGDS